MIKEVLIVPYSKENGDEILDKASVLWPSKRKAVKVFSDYDISSYKFRYISTEKTDRSSILVNKFESVFLQYVSEHEGLYIYESEKLSTKKFLGFNLGLLELSLVIGDTKFQLSTLNNKQALLDNSAIGYIYETVASSEFFSFYISQYLRANASSSYVENTDKSKHFWISIATANELLEEVGSFLSGELEFTNRVHNSSLLKKYSRESIIEDRDIHWLMENPNEMFISESGDIPYLGLKYDIDFISQSITCVDYDTYENRLIISCLYSIKSTLEELIFNYKDVKYFPHVSVTKILDETSSLINALNCTLKLLPPFNTKPEFSNKYLDDVRYVRLFGLITKWYSYNDLDYGNESRSPILGITEIFEHYCFIKIVESFEINNFVIDEVKLKSLEKTGAVTLTRLHETISIYYEPIVSVNEFTPLKCSKKITHYHPDIVIIYKNQDTMKCGVIDPKFAIEREVRKKLAPSIFYKYGLFFHRPDGLPIDFVYAMYPDLDGKTSSYNHRDELVSREVTPELGDFTIPFHEKCAELMSSFINQLVVENV